MAAQLRLPRHGPQRRPENPAAVKGCGGHEVEDAQYAVDPRQPAEGGDDELGAAGRSDPGGEEREGGRQGEADGGPDRGDPQIRTRAAGLTPQCGDAAQHPQGEALDFHSFPPGDQRVAHLVGEQRDVEGQPTDQRGDQVGGLASAGRLLGELGGGQAPHHQPEDHERAPVDAQLEPGDPPHAHDVALLVSPLFGTHPPASSPPPPVSDPPGEGAPGAGGGVHPSTDSTVGFRGITERLDLPLTRSGESKLAP